MKTYQVEIDDETEKMLLRLSTQTGHAPHALIVSLVAEVLVDDFGCHQTSNVVPFPGRR